MTDTGTGETDGLAQTGYITVTESATLTADFSATPTSGDSPLEVQFTDESTPGGAADAWQWDFGDGGTSTAQHPVYTYTTAGVYTVTLTVTDTDTAETDTLIRTNYIQVDLPTTVINYEYDGLYRLTEAVYTGAFSATLQYEYDAVGNRLAYTETITSTMVITYRHDAANRLVESVELEGDTTTYAWDDAGRLITTTRAGNVTRLYQYDQRGNLIRATVNGLTTTFDYDGENNRLRMTVDGEATAFTPDYLREGRVLFETGGASASTRHYLYGLACVGEHVDAGEPESAEWRYYQRDGNQMVRQTSDDSGAVTLAWTYSPEGMVLEGEEGPVTHLGCEGNTVYDWSTGLIFKNGWYWDPRLGIWITLAPLLLVWQAWLPHSRRKRGKRWKRKRVVFALSLLLLLALLLAGCDRSPPTPTPCPPGTSTPPAVPPAIDSLKSSVQIVTSAAPTAPGTPIPQARAGLGTVVDGPRRVILTHDHYHLAPVTFSQASFIIILDYMGNRVAQVERSEVLFEDYDRNPSADGGLAFLDLPNDVMVRAGAYDVFSNPARIAVPSNIRNGDSVQQVYRTGRELKVQSTTVREVKDNELVLDDPRLVISRGDSGGGVLLNNKHIGNTWSQTATGSEVRKNPDDIFQFIATHTR